MPFGLHSSSATFQRALDSVIGAEMKPVAFAYLDDIIVISATEEQHFANGKFEDKSKEVYFLQAKTGLP